MPGMPIGPNAGTLPFWLTAAQIAAFLGLSWTRAL
jgi:hypothetical protein